jgi:glucan 1,3-beta-glucosidase
VSNHPHWQRQAAGGMVFAAIVFAAAGLARRRLAGSLSAPMHLWLAVAVNAAVAGIFVGLAIEKVPVESLGAGGWIRSIALVVLAIVMPLAASAGIMRAAAIPSFASVLAALRPNFSCRLTAALGLMLVALTLVAIQIALGLVFDPRYKDFPYAPLSAAVVPFLLLSLTTAAPGRRHGAAEIVAAATLVLSAGYIVFNETFANWQSVWFCALIVALAGTLFRSKDAAAPG